MNTYNWNIVSLECKPNEDGLADVIINANWIFTATSSEKSEFTNLNGDVIVNYYTSNCYGSQSFTLKSKENFIPYKNLTKEQVIGWVQDSIGAEGVALLEANLNTQIESQINPPIVTPPLPW